MKHAAQCLLSLTCVVSLIFSISSCSSGGGEGAGAPPPVSTTTQIIVSGTVQAPGGQIAFFKKPGFGDWLESEANAAVTGLALVSDGTTVELGRIGHTAPFSFSLISSTMTSGGRYTFNFTNLGLSPDIDLVVGIRNGATELRAFVTGTTVHISPMSEVAFLRSMEHLANNLLTNYTIQELTDISGAIALLANVKNLSFTAQTIAQTLASIREAIEANSALSNFLTAAALPGHSSQGPGDIGNYFPFDDGSVWRYQGTVVHDNAAPVPFQNSVMTTGSSVVNGINTSVFLRSNSDGQGKSDEAYLSKDLTGISRHASGAIPIKTVHFPLAPEVPIAIFERTGFPLGQDLDGDGINDTVDVKAETVLKGFEVVTVLGGTYQNCARTEYVQVNTYHSSASSVTATVTITRTEWLAPGVGFVKRLDLSRSQGFVQDFSETITEELVEFIPSFRFTSLSVEGLNGCGLLASGKAYCWGWNGDGQLGSALPYPQAQTPAPVSGSFTFSSIVPGCGIAVGGQAYCWGRNDFGQLGNGTVASSPSPSAVNGGLIFASMNTPGATTCGVTTKGAAYCWGANAYGSLGNGSTTPSPIPVPVAGNLIFSSVSSSGEFACGVTTSGKGYCWGNNQFGQLGNGSTINSAVPVPVSGGHVFSRIKIGNASACGLTTNNDLYCWGINHNGEFGNGSTSSGSSAPVLAAGGLKLITFDAGAGSYCGLIPTGAAYCWGFGLQGQLGNATAGFSYSPVPVSGEHTFVSISAGLAVCGLTTEGAAYCWGSNSSGELGNPTAYPQSTIPVRVFPPS
jgi:alpha-tubulin suppressor-like RCC1 family protein